MVEHGGQLGEPLAAAHRLSALWSGVSAFWKWSRTRLWGHIA